MSFKYAKVTDIVADVLTSGENDAYPIIFTTQNRNKTLYRDQMKLLLEKDKVWRIQFNKPLNNRYIIDFYSREADNKPEYTFIFGLCVCDDFEFLEKGEPQLSDEHIAYKWVSLGEIEELDFLPSIDRIKHKIKPFLERFY